MTHLQASLAMKLTYFLVNSVQFYELAACMHACTVFKVKVKDTK